MSSDHPITPIVHSATPDHTVGVQGYLSAYFTRSQHVSYASHFEIMDTVVNFYIQNIEYNQNIVVNLCKVCFIVLILYTKR